MSDKLLTQYLLKVPKQKPRHYKNQSYSSITQLFGIIVAVQLLCCWLAWQHFAI